MDSKYSHRKYALDQTVFNDLNAISLDRKKEKAISMNLPRSV